MAIDADAAGDPMEAVGLDPISTPNADVDAHQAYELFNTGAVFIDARNRGDYDAGCVEGAFHIKPDMVRSGEAFAILDTLIPEMTVVIYCYGGDCDSSHNLAIELEPLGFTDLRIMTDSYDDWAAAGYPVQLPQDINAEAGGMP